MIPFPKIVDVNPLSEQMNFEAALRNSSKRASSSVGVLIAIAKKLSGDRDFMSSVVKNVQQIMGKMPTTGFFVAIQCSCYLH